MSGQRIEGYKHFVTKIWNAARLCLMNTEDFPGGDLKLKKEDYSLCDRWILARLNRTVAETTKALDEYRFNDACSTIYSFIWHEFCDWYLELIKPALYGKDHPKKKLAAQETMLRVLKTAAQLLHPFMPFVTEEIWYRVVGDGSSVMVSLFPAEDPALRDDLAEKEMGMIIDVVGIIRNIRGEKGIAPSKKLKVLLSAADTALIPLLEDGRDFVSNMARLEDLKIAGAVEDPKGAATGVAGSVKVFILLEGEIDKAGERARLQKEISRLEKDLAAVTKKLENKDFMTKAAEAVIRKEEDKNRDIQEKLGILNAALNKLG
jgi:valyl-tRNA synthetase